MSWRGVVSVSVQGGGFVSPKLAGRELTAQVWLADSRKQSTASCCGDKLRWPKSQVVELSGNLQDLHIALCERGRLRAKCTIGLVPLLPVGAAEVKTCTSLFDDEVAMVDESSQLIAKLRIRLALKRGNCVPLRLLNPSGNATMGDNNRSRQVRRAVSPQPESAMLRENDHGICGGLAVAEAGPAVPTVNRDGRSRSPGGVQTVPPRIAAGRSNQSPSPIPRATSSVSHDDAELAPLSGPQSRQSSCAPTDPRALLQREPEAKKTAGLPRPVTVRTVGDHKALGLGSDHQTSHILQVQSTLADISDNGDGVRPPRLEGAHLRAALSETKVLLHTEISSLRSQAQHGLTQKCSREQQLEEEVIRLRKLLPGGDDGCAASPWSLQCDIF
mmetsp:Transcript_75279/g.201029  ORF Transcript_75279/g.201029 Transcript_75279/m.201029 type:complete len:387 (-) Transcript_75279:389-1549(-)